MGDCGDGGVGDGKHGEFAGAGQSVSFFDCGVLTTLRRVVT